eukprot:gene9310-biopygen22706
MSRTAMCSVLWRAAARDIHGASARGASRDQVHTAKVPSWTWEMMCSCSCLDVSSIAGRTADGGGAVRSLHCGVRAGCQGETAADADRTWTGRVHGRFSEGAGAGTRKPAGLLPRASLCPRARRGTRLGIGGAPQDGVPDRSGGQNAGRGASWTYRVEQVQVHLGTTTGCSGKDFFGPTFSPNPPENKCP